MTEPPLHRRHPRMWNCYYALCARLCIEPIPGHLLDRALLNSEFRRLHGLALDSRIDVSDIIEEAVR